MQRSALMEALLFSDGRSWQIVELGKALEVPKEEVVIIAEELRQNLSNRGIVLVSNGEEISLGTHPDAAAMLEKIRKEELTGPLTKQALETLAIIAYGDAPGKSLVDGIRGVNSYMTLRNLVERGLIERLADPSDKRAFKYRITTDALRHLGISSVSELPGFAETKKILEGQTAMGETGERTAEAPGGPLTEAV